MSRQNRGPHVNYVNSRARWSIQWSETGRVSQYSICPGNSSETQTHLAEFVRQRELTDRPTGPRDPGQFPIVDALTLYGEQHAPYVAAPQRIGYAISALVPFWGALAAGDITRETCRAYGRVRGKAPGTIRRELAILRAALNYAKTEGRLTYAPTVHLPRKPAGRDRWLRRGEVAALLNAARNGHASTRYYLPLFILIALYTGARKGAILSLRWPQVDLAAERINFNEMGRTRTSKGRAHLPIPKRLLTFLRLARLRGTDGGYVLHRNGMPLDSMKRAFNSACSGASLEDVTPHTLRHTCGTWLAQAGVPVDKIGGWLGHSDARTTQLYAHHHPDFMEQARNAADRRRA